MAINYDLGSVSSYAIAVQHGFTGTIDDWVDTIKDASQVYDNLVGEIEDFANSIPLLDSTLSHNDQAANAFAVGERIEQLKSLISAPQAASTVAEMTDTSKVYVYTGSEAGYVYGDWYYYDSTQEAWVDGGPYQSSAEGGGITSQEKSLILTLFSKAAYAEDDAGEAYDQLSALWSVYSITWAGTGYTHGNTSVAIDGGKTFSSTITASGGHTISTVTATMGGVTVQGAWNNGTVTIPNVTGDIVITVTTVQATVSSISAVYTQSGTVYDTDSLDSLKSDLVVTATYVDQSTYVVPSADYTLSGTLAEGTSTVTVSYGGQTTTFTVTVSAMYVQNGLIHWYDAINNTGSGHSNSTTLWKDLVGQINFANEGTSKYSWGDNALIFTHITGQEFVGSGTIGTCSGRTVEICLEPSEAQTGIVCVPFYDSTHAEDAYGKISVFTDNTFGVKGQAGVTYSTGLNSATDVRHIASSFTNETTINKAYCNGAVASLSSNSHSMRNSYTTPIIGSGIVNDSNYGFKGKIYSVRIYDRILTDAEISKNYAVDVSRFGLE